MKKQFLIILLVLVLFSVSISLVSAAPAMWGLALNHETKECAGYWSGDEYVYYDLPEGWEAYYSRSFKTLETIFGECYVEETRDSAVECCKQLGLKFIDYETILHYQEQIYIEGLDDEGPYECEPHSSYGVAVNKISKECTEAFWYGLTKTQIKADGGRVIHDIGSTFEGGRCSLDENWVRSTKKDDNEYRMITPVGECDFLRYYEQECCAQLGYTYVSNNIGEKRLTNLGIGEKRLTNLGVVEMGGWFIDNLFIPIFIVLVVLFIILKLKFKSFIPFIKSYPKKGLFVGLIVGIISFLNFLIWFIGSGDYFTLRGNDLIATILLISAFPITFGGVDMIMGGGNLITLLFLNLIYFGLIGLLVGFLVRFIIKKVKKR